jgi:hypothetical protein
MDVCDFSLRALIRLMVFSIQGIVIPLFPPRFERLYMELARACPKA